MLVHIGGFLANSRTLIQKIAEHIIILCGHRLTIDLQCRQGFNIQITRIQAIAALTCLQGKLQHNLLGKGFDLRLNLTVKLGIGIQNMRSARRRPAVACCLTSPSYD